MWDYVVSRAWVTCHNKQIVQCMPSLPLSALLILLVYSTLPSASSHRLPLSRHLAALESPCGQGQSGVDNGTPVIPNGCGSGQWVQLLEHAPYKDTFTPCCQAHDECYGVCAWPDLQAGLKQCNDQFKSCMSQQCKQYAGQEEDQFVRWVIEITCGKAGDLYHSTVESAQSRQIYQDSQKEHCECT